MNKQFSGDYCPDCGNVWEDHLQFGGHCPPQKTKEETRKEALGYNKTLGELLEDKNSQIVRLAKGIKKELNK